MIPNYQQWKMIIDESYINIKGNRWVYLCVIIDSFNNEIIASKISDSRDLFLLVDVLQIAINKRNPNGILSLWIDHYNYKRIQSNLDWMLPKEYSELQQNVNT